MNKKTGELIIITGPMMGGKTTELVRQMESRLIIPNTKALFINPSIDTRATNGFSTHSKLMINPNQIMTVRCRSKLDDVDIKSYNIIGIDEAQFFNDLSPIRRWVDDGKSVIVAGLISDFKKNSFGHIFDIMSYADDIKFVPAICTECAKNGSRKPASFSRRNIKSENQLYVSNEDSDYSPVCRYHHIIE
jgi:thymidine kinase